MSNSAPNDTQVPVRVRLHGEPFTGAARRIAAELADETVASRLCDGDASVHAGEPADRPPILARTAAGRLGWVYLRGSRALVGQVEGLRSEFVAAGAHRVLLVATPSAAAGARALAEPFGARLTVLDGADPVQVADALAGELDETVLVVADAAGDDPVVAAVHRVLAEAITAELGDGDPDDPIARATLAERTVYLTEPGSALDERGRADGSVVVTVDADVPERFSALGPFGLVPAGLAGADVGAVVSAAVAAMPVLAADDPDNPALLLAGALVTARASVLAVRGAEDAPGAAGWVAQLVSGAQGPLVVVSDDDLGEQPPVVDVGGTGAGAPDGAGVRTTGGIGARMVLWHVAVAAAARRLGTDPYAEPDRSGVDPGPRPPVLAQAGVEVHAGPWLPDGVGSVSEALAELVRRAPDDGHLAVAAWLDPESDASVGVLRGLLAERAGLPTTFGWAPRGWPGELRRHLGAADGVHCHLTGGAPDDVRAPELAELDSLHAAQARSAVAALDERGLPVLRLHLTDRVAGLVTLARAVQDLPGPARGR